MTPRMKAKAAGERHYHGRPCLHGHGTLRRTSDAHCIECERLKDHSARARARRKARYTPAKQSVRNQDYYARNRERLIAARAERREREREHIRQLDAEWHKRNPVQQAVKRRNRRARLSAAEGRHTGKQIKALYDQQGGCCAACGTSIREGYHADHIIPLVRGGTNWISNIQLLCPPCNLSKATKTPEEWEACRAKVPSS